MMRSVVFSFLLVGVAQAAGFRDEERLFKCDAPAELSIIAILEGKDLLPLVTIDMPIQKGVTGSRVSCISRPTLQRTNTASKSYQVFCNADRLQLVVEGYDPQVKSLLRFRPEGFLRYECVPTN